MPGSEQVQFSRLRSNGKVAGNEVLRLASDATTRGGADLASFQLRAHFV